MNFRKAGAIILAVLFFHALGLIAGLYSFWDWYDVPMHFGGGLAMGALGIALWQEGIDGIRFKGRLARHLEWWLVPVFVLGFVSSISIGWEFHEFLLDQVSLGVRQPSVADTMADFFFDGAGGIAALFIWSKKT
ncbi:MAG: hypothetical protein ACD_76C00018G0002 [uncultured bacterium]|nr:MAG: hypothetical protein ACD_76C00018G0002 [uncultured bacterium]HBD05032.1 hypothetical protein [Candidatus Uhrbacteria bacterium]